jgi:hypothetical protein
MAEWYKTAMVNWLFRGLRKRAKPIAADYPIIVLDDGAIKAFKVPFEVGAFLDKQKVWNEAYEAFDLYGRPLRLRVVSKRPYVIAELPANSLVQVDDLREVLSAYLLNSGFDQDWIEKTSITDIVRGLVSTAAYVQAGIDYPVVTGVGYDIDVFESAELLDSYLEGQDVDAGLYSAYDSAGRMLRLYTHNVFVLVSLAEKEPHHAAYLRTEVSKRLIDHGAEADSLAAMTLPELVQQLLLTGCIGLFAG